ncbi:MAG: hypothetical protein EOP48_14365 [Sphingobacteriales bacterium]|nr:MAG: hypothetical protein EOP48_14365 [Sphingobacteriales bacterium]
MKSDDSLIVTYFSIDGDVIKQEKHLFRGQGCAYNKSTTYFDNKNRPVFIEYFEQPCLTEEERKIDNSFEKITYWYERFLYDSTDRVSSKVFWYPNVKARRFQYRYDENGKVSQQSWRIKDNEFWN